MKELDERLQLLELVRSSPFLEDELLALESRIQKRLPDVFRWFLLTFGECCFYRCTSVDFISCKEINRCLDTEGEFPKTVLPFTDDGYSNAYCISLRDDSFGKIYYWRHDVGWDAQADDVEEAMFQSTLRLVADDFGEFVLSLPIHEK